MNGQYILQKIANIDICSGPLYQLDRMQGQGNSANQIFTSWDVGKMNSFSWTLSHFYLLCHMPDAKAARMID